MKQKEEVSKIYQKKISYFMIQNESNAHNLFWESG